MIDSVGGKLAAQALQQPQGMEEVGKAGKKEGGASFQEVMNKQTEAANQIDQVDQAKAPEKVDGMEKTDGVAVRLENFMKGVLKDEAKIDKMMERCMNGGPVEPKDMMQIQALVYSYSQKIDLTTKIVEKSVGGLKQLLNTQV